MRLSKYLICAVLAVTGTATGAVSPSSALMADLVTADVVLLGETHDNPDHHAVQAEIIARMQPKALVWEMLTDEEAGRVNAMLIRDPDKLERILQWAESGWPDFSMYLPIFEAVPEARLFGGEVPRQAALAALEAGPAVAFGADAARYGLTVALAPDEQAEREMLQLQAHCGALGQDRLAGMVAIQRLRDAVLARAALRALDETGGPVAVITGNGHARRDWGIPVYLERAQPGVRVFALGQSEQGQIVGAFDTVLDSPPVPREDPCAAFQRAD